jgi:hypothetical protein
MREMRLALLIQAVWACAVRLALYASPHGGVPTLEVRVNRICRTPRTTASGWPDLHALGIPRLNREADLVDKRPEIPLAELAELADGRTAEAGLNTRPRRPPRGPASRTRRVSCAAAGRIPPALCHAGHLQITIRCRTEPAARQVVFRR